MVFADVPFTDGLSSKFPDFSTLSIYLVFTKFVFKGNPVNCRIYRKGLVKVHYIFGK